MAEPDDPRRPPGGYLPRIAKFTPPEGEDGDGSRPRRRKAAAAPEAESVGEKADGPGETPRLETVEGRQRTRLVVGGLAVAALAVALLMLGRSLATRDGDDPGDEDPVVDETAIVAAQEKGVRSEGEAADLVRRARDAAGAGNAGQAVAFLENVRAAYPRTRAAAEAEQAMARTVRGLPLFVEGDALRAEQVEPPPPEPPAQIVALPVAPPPTPPTTEAAIARPEAPREARRAPGGSTLPRADVAARPLPDGFRSRAGVGVHASGWPLEIVGDRDGATLVLVPGGEFTLGLDDGPIVERPAREIRLSTYYIDQHEVTVGQFDRFRAESGHPAPPTQGDAPGSTDPDRPVVLVSHADAWAYAAWAGKVLPTEAQWEMAARTSDGRVHPWGPTVPKWDRPQGARQIDPIYSVPADQSPYGAFDLAGNAWEWTADWFDAKGYRGIAPGTADPAGPSRSPSRPPERVVRGGSKDWQSTWRAGMRPESRLPYVGFRCALPVEGPPPPRPAGPGRGPAQTPAGPAGIVPF